MGNLQDVIEKIAADDKIMLSVTACFILSVYFEGLSNS